ncbi:MAG TPA: hypothetical protein PLR06_09050 [Cyclobacteriaceae bacterium]|nr:hypothetical protein [Cyclobacteriaceae bacterium]
MNNKPDESKLVAYCYGELDARETEMVEQYLANHPDERKRMEEWAFTLRVMNSLTDKEVIPPPIFLGDEVQQRSFWKERYFRMTMGIAASFLFLLVAARILGLSVTYSQGAMVIGFGNRQRQPVISPAQLTEERVNQLITSSIENNNGKIKASLNESRESLEQSIQKNLNTNSAKIDRYIQNTSGVSQEQVRKFVAQLQNDNLTLMKDYMQRSSTGQKEYIETLMVDFSKYLEEQRRQDLQLFQVRMTNIEENTDQFKQETSQLLTALINPGNQGNTTRRN